MRRSSKKASARRQTVDWKAVGRRIRELRGFDTTQSALAERLGVSQGYLSSMERGAKEIGAEILLRISREFGVGLEWLLIGEGEASRLGLGRKGARKLRKHG